MNGEKLLFTRKKYLGFFLKEGTLDMETGILYKDRHGEIRFDKRFLPCL